MARLASVLTILLIVLAATTVQGQQEQKKIPPALEELLKGGPDAFLKRFDKDKDGLLSKDEAPPAVAAIFQKVDQNADGKLDRKELELLLQAVRLQFGPDPAKQTELDKIVDKLLAVMDTNMDGKISKTEARGKVAEFFEKFDANKDAFLERGELRAFLQATPAKGPFPGKKGPFPGKGPLDFDDYDRDADGRLSRAEVKGTRFDAVFDQIDTNRNGTIELREFESYQKKSAPDGGK